MRAIFRAALVTLAALSCTAAGHIEAASGAEIGETIALHGTPQGAPACVLCHGKSGEGQASAGFPRLAGLDAAYISHALASFVDGTRKSDVMTPIAQALSDADRDAIAHYFAGLARPPVKAATAPTPEMATGFALATHGDWSKQLPACSQCHGDTGLGVGASFPPLVGQPEAYLVNQLTAWKKGTRHDDPLGLMAAVAAKLDETDIKSVAAYYAALPLTREPPLPKPIALTSPQPSNSAAFTPPPESAIPDDEFGATIKLGENIFHDTQHYAPAFVGNALQCSNCHLDRGRLAGAAPLWAAYVAYPAYRAKNHRMNTFEERLQGCFRFSMNGAAPPLGDKSLVALQTYAFFLAKSAPTGGDLPGRGYPKLKEPAKLDYTHGQKVYAAHCALCHGDNGEGRMGPDGRTVFPPLWGPHSFNWGAGIDQIDIAASFIKANMPLGLGGTLSDTDAWDVATFMDSQERPQDPRFTGSVAETRAKFHDNAMSMYGRSVNGILLGAKAPPAGTVPPKAAR